MVRKALSIVLAVNVFTLSIAQQQSFSSPIEKQAYLDARYDVQVNDGQLSVDDSFIKRKILLQKSGVKADMIEQYRVYYVQYYAEYSNINEDNILPDVYKSELSKNSGKNIPVIVISSIIGLGIGFLVFAVLEDAFHSIFIGDRTN